MSGLDDEIDDLVDEEKMNEINNMNKNELKNYLNEHNIVYCKNKKKSYFKNLVIKYCALKELEYDDLTDLISQKYPTKRKLHNFLSEQIIEHIDNRGLNGYYQSTTIKILKQKIYKTNFSKFPKSNKSGIWYESLYRLLYGLQFFSRNSRLFRLLNLINCDDLIYCIMKDEELNTRNKK